MQIQTAPCTTIGYTDTPCLMLSDPGPDLVIDQDISQYISNHLQFSGNLVLRTSSNIVLTDRIEWHNCNRLTFISQNNITFAPTAYIGTSGIVELKSGIEGDGTGTVIFEGTTTQVNAGKTGKVIIHYNPKKGDARHKYHKPKSYYGQVSPLSESYMLVNNIQDLQDINYMLHMDYALSSNIHLESGSLIFKPIIKFVKATKERIPFSGSLEGNGYSIQNLGIHFPNFVAQINIISAFAFFLCSSDGFRHT